MMAKKTAGRSRGLVIGHLERISSGIFDRYSRVITDLVGGRHGIYALYRNERLYYVGLARDLRGRVKQHLRDRHKGKWNYFSLYLARSERFLKDLESLAIRIAFPKGNRAAAKFAGAPDLAKPLRRRIRAEALREIEQLMGAAAVAAPSARTAKARRTRGRAAKKTKREPGLKGLLGNKALRGRHKGRLHRAWVYGNGRIRYDRVIYNSPSLAAAAAVRRKTCNGWSFWRYKNDRGEWVKLAELRTKKP